MDKSDLARLSKLMSLMLRHDPHSFGIFLDAEGYASTNAVLTALRSRMPNATEADVVAVVNTIEPDKRRFSIVDDEIRANYGHSLQEKIVHQRATPPDVLLHGTTAPAYAKIKEAGLRPMKRQYVHLTTDRQLAERVGGRHGRPLILMVDAKRAHADGVAFYRANESFWLAEYVAAAYISVA